MVEEQARCHCTNPSHTSTNYQKDTVWRPCRCAASAAKACSALQPASVLISTVRIWASHQHLWINLISELKKRSHLHCADKIAATQGIRINFLYTTSVLVKADSKFQKKTVSTKQAEYLLEPVSLLTSLGDISLCACKAEKKPQEFSVCYCLTVHFSPVLIKILMVIISLREQISWLLNIHKVGQILRRM